MLKEGVGFSRDFTFDEPAAQIADDLHVSRFQGTVNLTRTPQGLYVRGRLSATTRAECARCVAEFDQLVTSRPAELYFYPRENAPPGAAAVGDDVHLNLAPLVREDMLLSVPMHTLCRPDCRGLCPQCGQDWNEGPCDCEDEAIDPRLAVLAQLLKSSKE